jgi:hypothetical protein
MNDNSGGYGQGNQADRVIANQGGPQYNSHGDQRYNSGGGPQNNGDGWQYNSGGGPQHNGEGPQYNNTGNGSFTVNQYLQQAEDLFNNGLEALKNQEYAHVVAIFRKFFSTAAKAESANGGSSDRSKVKGARAHVYTALGLLNGTRPSFHSSEDIREIEKQLEAARSEAYGTSAAAMADIVLAIVKEDFYDERGIPAGPPRAEDLRVSITDVEPPDLADLAKHVAPSEGQTWREMAGLASGHGYSVPVQDEEERPQANVAGRRTKVRKYFTKTPDPVSQALHLLLFGAAVLLVVVAIVSQSVFGLVLVAAAAWVGKKGYDQHKKYRAFLRKWEAAEPKPSDEELDRWLEADTDEITRKGARKLQIRVDKELSRSDLITPAVVVVGVPDPDDPRTGKFAFRVGKDGRVRADQYMVLVLFLTRQVVSTYRCALDFASGDLLADETRQYHWGNIVGVSSVSVPAPKVIADLANLLVATGEKTRDISSLHQFTLSIVNGDTLPVTTEFGGSSFASSGGKVAWRGNDYALSIIQSEVRARNAR